MSDLPKPRFGQPCNHCGLCCRIQLCHIGRGAFGEDHPAPCPALLPDGTGRHFCSIVAGEAHLKMEPLVAKSLGIGCGCSSPDDDTTEAQIRDFDRMASAIIALPWYQVEIPTTPENPLQAPRAID